MLISLLLSPQGCAGALQLYCCFHGRLYCPMVSAVRKPQSVAVQHRLREDVDEAGGGCLER